MQFSKQLIGSTLKFLAHHIVWRAEKAAISVKNIDDQFLYLKYESKLSISFANIFKSRPVSIWQVFPNKVLIESLKRAGYLNWRWTLIAWSAKVIWFCIFLFLCQFDDFLSDQNKNWELQKRRKRILPHFENIFCGKIVG